MMNRICRGLEKWGHYLLALLCAGVILLSSAWTRDQKNAEKENRPALSDQSERMDKKEETQDGLSLQRPVQGTVMRRFSDTPVYFPSVNVWQSHPCLDFTIQSEDEVLAMAPGTVFTVQDGVVLDHGNGVRSVYRGLLCVLVQPGQSVGQGALLGRAGGAVPFEGPGHICVQLLSGGEAVPFGEDWE